MAQTLEGTLARCIRRNHFQDRETKAVDIKLLRVLLLQVLLAMTQLLVLGLCVDMLNSNVTDLDLAVIGIDVDRLTCQFAVHNVVLMEVLQAFKDFSAPVLDDLEPRHHNLLQVLADRTGRDELRNHNQLLLISAAAKCAEV